MAISVTRYGLRTLGICIRKFFTVYLIVAFVFYTSPIHYAYANPQGGVVSSGSANIVESGKNLTVNQSSDKAIIDWRSFNIEIDEATRFNQPSSSSMTLNRVNDMNPSHIFGSLSANGTIMLINPNGVLFGKDSRVDVNSLVATTANISNQNFMNNHMVFDSVGSNPNAAIINEGVITAADAGLVGLVAPNVSNRGVINARLGKVHLASGDSFALDMYGDGLIGIGISDNVHSQIVSNTGVINAAGGVIQMTAAAGRQMVNSLIEVKGELRAPSVAQKNGKIYIFAEGSNAVQGNVTADKGVKSGQSTVMVSGVLDASGLNTGEKGGEVAVLGDDVTVKSTASLDASGASGGGSIMIGGGAHGLGLPTAATVKVEEGANLNASATYIGNGGTIVTWADKSNTTAGILLAKGGANGGDGGFIETSAKEVVNFEHGLLVDASSRFGAAGLWLIDPQDLTIDATGASNIVSTLNGGTNVTATTSSCNASYGTCSGSTGNITLSSAIAKTAGGNATLTLTADNNIILNAGISSNTGQLAVTLNATGNVSGSSSGTINTNGGLLTINAGSGSGTLVGVVSGTGALTKSGSGALTLSNANTYTGATTVSAGTLTLTNTSASNALSIASGAVLEVGSASTYYFNATTNSSISGAGTLRKIGSGTITFASGGTDFIWQMNGGSLIDVQAGRIYATTNGRGVNWTNNLSSLNVASGAIFDGVEANVIVDSITGSGSIRTGYSGYLGFTFGVANGSSTFSGVISNSTHTGSLIKVGSGTITLSGANTYTGATTVSAGTLKAGSTSAFGSNSATTVAGSAILDIAGFNNSIGSLTGAGTVTNSGSAATITAGGNNTSTTFSGVIQDGTGATTLTKSGSGTLTLSGANTYTGGTNINAGALNLGSSGAIGSSGTISFGGGTLQYSASNTTDYSSRFSSAGSQAWKIDTNSQNVTFATVLAGTSSSVTKSGSGTLTLSGENTYTGGTNINGGTLNLGSSGAIGSSGTISFGGGALQYSASNTTDYSSRFSSAGSQSWSINTNSQNITFASVLAGTSSSITKSGSGTLTLSGTNTYTGATTVSAGTLNAGSISAFGSNSATTVSASAILDMAGFNHSIGSLAGAGTVTNSGSAATLTAGGNGTSTTFSGVIQDGTGTTTLTKLGSGTLTLSGANTFTGGTNINAGTLSLGSSGAIGSSGTISFGGGTLQYSASNTTDYSSRFSSAGSQIWSINTNSQNITFATVLAGASSITKSGSGTLTLSGANTYTGGTNINGGALNLGSSGAIGSSGTISFGGGALQYSASNTTDYSSRFSSAGSQSWSIDTNSQNITFASVLAGTSSSITKSGSGTLTLSGTNTYTGTTTVSAGTLKAGSTSAFGSNSATTVSASAILDMAGFNHSIGSLAGAGTVTNSGSAATLTAGGNGTSTTFSGVIQNGTGTTTLTKLGSGTLTLSGANTYTGATTVNSGTLLFGGSGTTPNTNTITINSGGTLGFGKNDTWGNESTTTSAAIIVNTGGTVSSNGFFNTLWNLTLNGGTLNANGGVNGTYGSFQLPGTITITGNAQITSSGSNSQINIGGKNNAITIFAISSSSDSLTAAVKFKDVNGAASYLTKSGSGTLTLSGANTYSGGTNINGGTLNLGSSGAIGSSGTISFGGGTLQYSASNTTDYSSRFSSAGSQAWSIDTNSQNVTLATALAGASSTLTKLGSGTLTLSGTNTYTGATTVSVGTLKIGSAGSLGSGTYSGAISVASGAILQYSSSAAQTLSGIISGAGVLTKDTSSSSTLTLSGANTYTGATTVSAGTLTLSGSLNVGSGTATTSVASGAILNGAGVITAATLSDSGAGTFSLTGSNMINTLTTSGTVGAFTLNNAQSLAVGSITSSGVITITESGSTSDLTLSGGTVLTSSASGDAIILSAGRNFINNSGSDALALTGISSPRWLIYSTNPASDTLGGLVSANRVYNKTYAGYAPASVTQSGNVSLYSYAPTLTVTANSASKSYGDANPSFSATITGLLAGDSAGSAYSGSAGLTTNALLGSDAGSYTITAAVGTLASSMGYQFTYVNSTLTINPAALTVTAAAVSKTYGDADPTLTYSYGSFKNGDTSAVLSGSLDRASGEDVNTYAINQGSVTAGSNYTINYTSANLTITPAELTVTAITKSKTYGDADPTLTYSYGSFKNGDTSSVLSGSLTRDLGSNVGTYAINQGSVTAGSNYTISYTTNNLTITPAELTVTAAAKSKIYGDSDPTLTYSYGSFKNGDTSSVLSGSLARASGENVNTYAINQGSVTAGSNYTISYTSNSLSITPAELTVTAAAKTKTYGDADPTLTYSYGSFKNGDTNSVLSGSLSRASGENVNTYAIGQGSVTAGGNYTISYTSANLTISPASLTVTAAAKTKTYGDADPTLTYSYGSLKNGDTSSVLSGSLDRASGENVNTYAINQGSVTAGSNYTISYVSSNLTINPAALTVTAAAASKTYGDNDPTIAYTYGALKNGDTSSVFSGSLARASGSNVGVYAISQGTVTAGSNYTISYTGNNLTINQAALSVTATNATKAYASADQAFAYTYSALKNNDSASIFSGSLSRVLGENAGVYAINQGTLSAGSNYAITYTGGTLTINAAPVLVNNAIAIIANSISITNVPVTNNFNIPTNSGSSFSMPSNNIIKFNTVDFQSNISATSAVFTNSGSSVSVNKPIPASANNSVPESLPISGSSHSPVNDNSSKNSDFQGSPSLNIKNNKTKKREETSPKESTTDTDIYIE